MFWYGSTQLEELRRMVPKLTFYDILTQSYGSGISWGRGG